MGLDRMGQEEMEGLKQGWATFDHLADIGIRGTGTSMEEAFENGARALFSLIVEDIATISIRQEKRVECASYDLTGLFVAWINALIGFADLYEMVFRDFRVNIEGTGLRGAAIGERWSETRHGRGIEVKGATFTEAKIERKNGLWIAECVVDV